MRIDVWLSKVCLLKSRSQAKNGCQGERILLDDQPVKESHELREGEEITLLLPNRELRIRVREIPRGNVARKDAELYFEVLDDRPAAL